MVPTWSIARWALVTSGRLTEISVVPSRETSGSATPSSSIRSRMMLDRAFDVVAADLFDLAGGRALVDQFDAALEVEPEPGRLVGDDQGGDDDQPEDEEQHEER